MRLNAITVQHGDRELTYSTLVTGLEDIRAIAKRGTDAVGRRILSMSVTLDECSPTEFTATVSPSYFTAFTA